MQIELRTATLADVPALAVMNRQLILDEGSRNTMTLEQLEERLTRWLEIGRTAVLILRDEEVIGYVLFYYLDSEYFPHEDSLYIRQVFIHANWRRRGIGQIAFERIAEAYFPPDKALILDVLETNPEGKQFWLKLGFTVQSTTLRRDPTP